MEMEFAIGEAVGMDFRTGGSVGMTFGVGGAVPQPGPGPDPGVSVITGTPVVQMGGIILPISSTIYGTAEEVE